MATTIGRALYRKNIRQWEQWSRVVAGLVMAVAAFAVSAPLVQVVLVGSGVAMVVTGVVGWCPACAAFGRRIDARADRDRP